MKSFLQFTVVLAVTTFAIGCSGTPAMKSDPTDVAGTVTGVTGQPVGGVTLNFFPTSGSQMQGYFVLKADGKFATKLISGKYTFAFEGNPQAMASIPTKYHSNDAAHTIDIPSAGEPALAIKLTN